MHYRRKPIYIQAVQWWRHGDHAGVTLVPPKKGVREFQSTKYGWLDTQQGGHVISPGDWIVMNSKGEIGSINPVTFARLYEPADEVQLSVSTKAGKSLGRG